ncbi:sulfatase-like hydrolase/transferase [Caballeronia novacaledonica]|uniref:Sulfatase-like hydrolase/transferase n=1 Tax=Caballeronia novacaledonica TaxID=1544861 RepID=A0AA37MS78_9BURK|nr:sulfatase-like hydrolase/transferase [Caballeronia novacaledonica]GJH29356.1 sulfatase-like hydrolase/transferase [Caballeronia novacaledonica]
MNDIPEVKKRPNILLITSDQHRGDCYGFEGRKVRTPNLDKLAAGGTRFSACITPNVVCQPSRASMLTGLLPSTHGVSDNGIDLSEEAAGKGFASQLSGAGYQTGFVGKAHFSTYVTFRPTGRPECIQSSGDFPDDWFGPYMGFDRVEMMLIGHNFFLPEAPPLGLHYEKWFYKDGKGPERIAQYLTRLPPEVTAPQTFNSGLPVEVHNSTWVGDQTIDFLRAHSEDDEPFCLWTSFPDPHHPFDAPAPWNQLHHPDEVDLPQHRTRDLEQRPWWHKASVESTPDLPENLRRIREEYSRIGEVSDQQLRELIGNYYGMISLIDHNVGRIMDALRETGLDKDTIVVFTSDHGDWLGDHGLILKGPMMYDGLMRVGLIASGPGIPAGKVVSSPVSTIDLHETFLDYAGTTGSVPSHGQSLRPLIEGEESRDFALNEWDLRAGRCGVALDLRTVRTSRYRMTVERNSSAGELYDLQEDPNEMVNLFDDPSRKAVRKELEDMLATRPLDAIEPPLPQTGTA